MECMLGNSYQSSEHTIFNVLVKLSKYFYLPFNSLVCTAGLSQLAMNNTRKCHKYINSYDIYECVVTAVSGFTEQVGSMKRNSKPPHIPSSLKEVAQTPVG